MRWRYGIIKNTRKHRGREFTDYRIGEIYYKDDPNKAVICSEDGYFPGVEEDPIAPQTEQQIIEEFIKEVHKIIKDIEDFKIIDANGPFESIKKKGGE
jgi:hypothetical protein